PLPVDQVAWLELVVGERTAEQLLELAQLLLRIRGDDDREELAELLLVHRARRGLLDLVPERLQQFDRAGHGRAALGMVEISLDATGAFGKTDAQRTGVTSDLVAQRPGQRRRVVGLAHHRRTD